MLRQDLPGLRLLQTLSHIFLLALFSFNFCLGPWYMWPQFIFFRFLSCRNTISWKVCLVPSGLKMAPWFIVGLLCVRAYLPWNKANCRWLLVAWGGCSEVISEPSVRGGPLVEWDKELGSCSFSPWTTLWFDLMKKDWDYTLTTIHFRLMAYVLNILLNVFFLAISFCPNYSHHHSCLTQLRFVISQSCFWRPGVPAQGNLVLASGTSHEVAVKVSPRAELSIGGPSVEGPSSLSMWLLAAFSGIHGSSLLQIQRGRKSLECQSTSKTESYIMLRDHRTGILLPLSHCTG